MTSFAAQKLGMKLRGFRLLTLLIKIKKLREMNLELAQQFRAQIQSLGIKAV